MNHYEISHLKITGPVRFGEVDFYEASSIEGKSSDWVYSCVAICYKNWKEGWPALGGTRWFKIGGNNIDKVIKETKKEAEKLALSMYLKNNILRMSEKALLADKKFNEWKPELRPDIFRWQGGKGVIWTPYNKKISDKENKRRYLTPHRLMCHGRLLEYIAGKYIGSKDLGISTPELKWIEHVTQYTIGLGCKKDTGEGTAHGVCSGLKKAVLEMGNFGTTEKKPLKGIKILVIGAGKVGLPLILLLHKEKAKVYVYDPFLEENTVVVFYNSQENKGGAVDKKHRKVLKKLSRQKHIFKSEDEALNHKDIKIISPNGGLTGWLSKVVPELDNQTRAQILACNRNNGGKLELILGAGNDQVPSTEDSKEEREKALRALDNAGITFIPDPLVSPGGVIAVSHELSSEWKREVVQKDAEDIVEKSVEMIFNKFREMGGTMPNSIKIYEAFEELINKGLE